MAEHADISEEVPVAVIGQCPNCDHDDHHGERCDEMADGDWCACSWELNETYYRDAVGYCERAEAKIATPTLFDLLAPAEGAA